MTFFERDAPWYAANSDPVPLNTANLLIYSSLDELRQTYGQAIREMDVVMVGSFTPEGVKVGEWIVSSVSGATIFYDIDTPVTLAMLSSGEEGYISRNLISAYSMYLSFTGGGTLDLLRQYGASRVHPLYCSADSDLYYPQEQLPDWDLGYLGTYSADRASSFENLLLAPARSWPEAKMIVAGPMYPAETLWPANVTKVEHSAPDAHRAFYGSLRFTLNLTREAMKRAGYSPSVRLFEAAACGCPIISDYWSGLDEFFRPKEEILVAYDSDDVLHYLRNTSEQERSSLARRARARLLAEHTGAVRARQLEGYIFAL